jgi:hypothetical protein
VPLFITEKALEPVSLIAQSVCADSPLGMDFNDFLPDTVEGIEKMLSQRHSLRP